MFELKSERTQWSPIQSLRLTILNKLGKNWMSKNDCRKRKSAPNCHPSTTSANRVARKVKTPLLCRKLSHPTSLTFAVQVRATKLIASITLHRNLNLSLSPPLILTRKRVNWTAATVSHLPWQTLKTNPSPIIKRKTLKRSQSSTCRNCKALKYCA